MNRFGSFANAIAAPLNELRSVDGMGEAGAAALKTVQAAALRLMRSEVQEQPLLSNWDQLMDYLNAVLSRERVEAVPHPVPGQSQPPACGRGAGPRHGQPHAGLPARGGEAGAGAARHGR